MDEDSVKIEIPEPSYTLFNAQRDGLPQVVVVNEALLSFQWTRLFSWHLRVCIEAEDLGEQGMPTAQESGFPQYVVTSWNGLTARAGTPPEIIKLLNAATNRALADPGVQQRARGLGIEMRGSTPEEMQARLARDIAKWRDVIDKAGIPKE